MSSTSKQQDPKDLGTCDYLVIGAGAPSMSFVDTLLNEQPNSKIILVDRHDAPGGHWNDAYGYVHLHQPSLLYGVASKQLEGSWLRLMMGGTLPWTHRASKAEILTYYKSLVEEWKAAGKVRFFPNCSYDFTPAGDDQQLGGNIRTFRSDETGQEFRTTVNVKLVNGVWGQNMVPSKCPPEFPVDSGVNLIPPNELYDSNQRNPTKRKGGIFSRRSYKTSAATKKYVVLGCGKTGMDAVVYLQRTMGVAPDDISWVIPNDVWMLNRSGGGTPWSYPEALLNHGGDFDKACRDLEEKDILVRLDKDIEPTRFRFPVVGQDELKLLRKVKNCIRHGRVTALVKDNESVRMDFGPEEASMYFQASDHVFVHCTSPGPFNGAKVEELFLSESQMNLFILFAPPVPISMSCLGLLESARRKGTLDLAFGRKLLLETGSLSDAATLSDNDVLKHLVHGYNPSSGAESEMHSIIVLGIVMALINEDPMVGYEWMRENRLSFFSVPGFKGAIYENLVRLSEEYKPFGFSESDSKLFSMLAAKLRLLRGK